MRIGQMNKLLNAKDVMAVLGVSRSTLHRLVKAGKFPPPIKLGAQARWRPDDIESALEAARKPAA